MIPGYIAVSIEGEAVQYQTANEAHYSALAGTYGTGYMLSKDGGETWTYVEGDVLAAEDATTDVMIKKEYVVITVNKTVDPANTIATINGESETALVYAKASDDSVTVRIVTNTVSEGNHTLTATISGRDYPQTITTNKVGVIDQDVTISYTANTGDRTISLKLAS